MPQAAKKFRQREKPAGGRVLGKHNYGPAWDRFRAHHATIVLPICKCCQAALPSRQMHLDHIKPIAGPEDQGFYDEANVQWLCVSCHSKKTAKECGLNG